MRLRLECLQLTVYNCLHWFTRISNAGTSHMARERGKDYNIPLGKLIMKKAKQFP